MSRREMTLFTYGREMTLWSPNVLDVSHAKTSKGDIFFTYLANSVSSYESLTDLYIRQADCFVYVIDMNNYQEKEVYYFDEFYKRVLNRKETEYFSQFILLLSYYRDKEMCSSVEDWSKLIQDYGFKKGSIIEWDKGDGYNKMTLFEIAINLHFGEKGYVQLFELSKTGEENHSIPIDLFRDKETSNIPKPNLLRFRKTFSTVNIPKPNLSKIKDTFSIINVPKPNLSRLRESFSSSTPIPEPMLSFARIVELLTLDYYDEKSTITHLLTSTEYNRNTLIKSKRFSYSSSFVIKIAIIAIRKKRFEANYHRMSGETLLNYCFVIRFIRYLENLSLPKSIKKSEVSDIINTIVNHVCKIYTQEEMTILKKTLEEITIDNSNDIEKIFGEYSLKIGGVNLKIEKVLEELGKKELFKKYEVISVLGYGGEGVVFKAFDISRDKLVAVKINFTQEFDLERAHSKIEFLKKEIDGKIICFECGLFEFGGNKSKYMYSVMQLGERTLKDIISSLHANLGKVGMNELIEMIEIFSKILSSIQNVHNQNIVHRDLDPKNIVKCKRKFKIIDFDQSRVAEIGKSITINIGKYCYMAPEVSENSYAYNDSLMMMSNSNSNESKLKQNNNIISTSCDIFSLGCILFELITNSPLRLNRNVMNNTFNSDNHLYFDMNGFYFHSCVSTMEGEKKLHFAIQKEIEKKVDCDERVKKLLIESIITMIQRDSTKRLNAFTYKLIMDNLRKFLKGEIADCYKVSEANLIPLDSIPNFTEIFLENKKNVIELQNLHQKLEEEQQLLLKEKNLLQKGYKLEYLEKKGQQIVNLLDELEQKNIKVFRSLENIKERNQLMIEENEEKKAHQLKLQESTNSQQKELEKLWKWKNSILNETPLPSGWKQILDCKSNEFYYFNQSLNITKWERPTQ